MSKLMGKVILQAKTRKMEADFAAILDDSRAVKGLKNVLRDLLRHSITEVCVLCDQPAAGGRICRRCRQILPWNDTFCERCGRAILAGQPAGIVCAACQSTRPRFEIARAPLVYDFPVDDVIKAIKFKRQLWYVPALAELLLRTLDSEFAAVDALVPVPLHRRRQMTRGFNQATELCRPLHRATGLPILTQAVRIRATSAQTGLNAAERQRNLRNAFAVVGTLKSRHPLIVDDVITTGETCSQLATTLLEAGAESVSVLTVARSRGIGRGGERQKEGDLCGDDGREGVVQDDSDKYDHADVMIVQEHPEAGGRFPVPGQPLVPGHQHRGNDN